MVTINQPPIINNTRLQNRLNMRMKRIVDIILSGFVLLFVFPVVYILIFICIKLYMPGPVLFKQRRTGRYGKVFTCYKFRTMFLNEEADSVQAVIGDSRITPLGRFLRITSIDELPQFWNVLKGDMSIIGPRPHMLLHTKIFSKKISNYNLRLSVKPGITGWAQINGYRGEITDESMQKRVDCDIWYINNWSLKLDFCIIFKTIRVMLGSK